MHMQILVSMGTVGAFPQIREMLPLCDIFDCAILSFLLDSASRSKC